MRLELHPRQSAAFLSRATEILYGGAAGGGKSHLLRAAGLYWCSAVPGLQAFLFRRLSDDLRRNHMEGPGSIPALAGDLIRSGLVRVNWQDGTVRFWNGSAIFLCHCQHEKDVLKYQGAEIHLLLIDELTHFSRRMYAFLRGRVRMAGLTVPAYLAGTANGRTGLADGMTARWTGVLMDCLADGLPDDLPGDPPGGLPGDPPGGPDMRAVLPDVRDLLPRIICGANPGGPGHNWVKADFIDGAPPMAVRVMPASEGGMRRQFIPAKLEDNPTLTASDPDYAARLSGLGDPALVRAMREGDWDIVAGGAFDDVWRRDRHVLPRFEVPASWRLDRSFDWGSSKPFSVGWWAESDGTPCVAGGTERHFPRGTLVRVRELYGWTGKADEGVRMPASEVAREILRLEAEAFPGRAVHPGPADSAIYAVENGTGIAADMAREGVRWVPADKRPGSRKTGLLTMRKLLAASLAVPMEEPGLFVTEDCLQFIRTIPSLVRDSRDNDDIDTRSEDHVYDEARYRAAYPRPEILTFKR